jgi:flagellar biosynthesis/type III secretory pathway protein FliH
LGRTLRGVRLRRENVSINEALEELASILGGFDSDTTAAIEEIFNQLYDEAYDIGFEDGLDAEEL